MFHSSPKYASIWPCLTVLTAYTVAGVASAFVAKPHNPPAPSVPQVLFAIFLPAFIFIGASWFTFFSAKLRQRSAGVQGTEFRDQSNSDGSNGRAGHRPGRSDGVLDSACDSRSECGKIVHWPLFTVYSARKPSYSFWKAFLIGAGVMAAFLPVIGLLAWGVELLLGWLGVAAPPQDAVRWLMSPDTPSVVKTVLVFGVILVAPFNEELFFRFTLYRVLDCKLRGRLTATLAVAALFAGIHFNAVAFIPVFCLSIIFSELMKRTGRFAAPLAAHMVFNAASVVLALIMTP